MKSGLDASRMAEGFICTYFFQLMIEAVRGSGANGDIALDDFSMIDKNCSEVENGNYCLNKFA